MEGLFLSLGFDSVQTYVQSGNVVFEDSDTDVQKVRDEIERKIARSFGFEVLVFVRTKEELQELVKGTPLRIGCQQTPRDPVVRRPADFPTEEIERVRDEAEKVSSSGREVHLFCPNGYGRTKLSNGFFERRLKVHATTRNWRTLNALLSIRDDRVPEDGVSLHGREARARRRGWSPPIRAWTPRDTLPPLQAGWRRGPRRQSRTSTWPAKARDRRAWDVSERQGRREGRKEGSRRGSGLPVPKVLTMVHLDTAPRDISF